MCHDIVRGPIVARGSENGDVLGGCLLIECIEFIKYRQRCSGEKCILSGTPALRNNIAKMIITYAIVVDPKK